MEEFVHNTSGYGESPEALVVADEEVIWFSPIGNSNSEVISRRRSVSLTSFPNNENVLFAQMNLASRPLSPTRTSSQVPFKSPRLFNDRCCQEGMPGGNTTPQTSTRVRPHTAISKEEKEPQIASLPLTNLSKLTLPQPFSFEQRDKAMMKKKEDFIKKVLEEEKKAREFHARPLPKNIFLQKKPFEPKRDGNHMVEVHAFHFATDDRARARQIFDQKLKEKEIDASRHKRETEEMLKKVEEEERAKFRKQAEYKAQPIKKYKEVKIMPSDKITVPISPKFATHNRIKNKENVHKEH